jgi:hypothetical protein
MDMIELRHSPTMVPITNARTSVEADAIYDYFLSTKKGQRSFDNQKAGRGITIHVVISQETYNAILDHMEATDRQQKEAEVAQAIAHLPPVPLPPLSTISHSESTSDPLPSWSTISQRVDAPLTLDAILKSSRPSQLWAATAAEPPIPSAPSQIDYAVTAATPSGVQAISIVDTSRRAGQQGEEEGIDREKLREALSQQTGLKHRAVNLVFSEYNSHHWAIRGYSYIFRWSQHTSVPVQNLSRPRHFTAILDHIP